MNYLPYILLVLSCVLITMRYSTRSKSFEDFALARNSFGSFAILSTVVASFVGGGTIIGLAEKSFMNGVGTSVAFIGFAIQIFLTGYIIAPRLLTKYGSALSVGDIFAKGYGHNAKIVMGIGWFLFTFGIITA